MATTGITSPSEAMDEIKRVSDWLGYIDPDELTERECRQLMEYAGKLSAWLDRVSERIGL